MLGLFSFPSPGAHSGEADDPSEWADVQKKVIPWENSVPDADSELPPQGRAARLRKSVSRLIVVASLTDKATNLGGLCRTCEVFGASALVVGNLQCVHDRQFQALSVSAEQWLPLVEVSGRRVTRLAVGEDTSQGSVFMACFSQERVFSLQWFKNSSSGVTSLLLSSCVPSHIPMLGFRNQ
ncbi:probable methyltransferase TARBP1 [Tupaia chinensis]|uniref:probable methyltransferase TARBP1 n=1 Tax=Tupaia chinensis TaxID=246437 RepID=UPI0007045BAF|nr:probable methyltransferase TARBP1 [Tupaia chinensis]